MRAFAFIFGIIFLVIGIAGFTSPALMNDHLAQAFRINLWLNILHIISGILACIVGCLNPFATRFYFQIIGIVYAIMALLGFVYEESDILGIFASNPGDTWFHMVVAIAALVLGYGAKD